MNSSDPITQTIETISSLRDNQLCIDCGKEPTSYLIIDYSGFICENCYKIHESLNFCQAIKPLSSPLSELETQIADIGGNTALYEYWDFYTLNYKPISYKYSTNASQYYKVILTQLLNSQETDSFLLNYETGREQSEAVLNSLTYLIEEVSLEVTEKKNAEKLKPKKTFISKIDEKIQQMGDSLISSQVYKTFEKEMESLSKELNNLF